MIRMQRMAVCCKKFKKVLKYIHNDAYKGRDPKAEFPSSQNHVPRTTLHLSP